MIKPIKKYEGRGWVVTVSLNDQQAHWLVDSYTPNKNFSQYGTIFPNEKEAINHAEALARHYEDVWGK